MHVAASEGKKHQQALQCSSSQPSTDGHSNTKNPHVTQIIEGAYPTHPQWVPLNVKLNSYVVGRIQTSHTHCGLDHPVS